MKKLLDPIFTFVWSFLAIQLLLEKLMELIYTSQISMQNISKN